MLKAARNLIFEEAAVFKRGTVSSLECTVYPSQANYLFFKGPEGSF